MLNDILRREDVKRLLKEICTNDRYNKKEDNESINYQQFPLFSQSLFIAVDAFYKYSVIIDDIYLLDAYVEEVHLLFKKVSNLSDISMGINQLIGKFSGLKLGYKNYLDKKNEILQYIYNQYIENGYVFHAVSSCYVDSILENDFTPQNYHQLYDKFIKVKDIVKDVIETDFSSEYVSFTDSFIMAYYYAISSPMYFYHLVSDNQYISSKSKAAYFKNDYDLCLKNLNKLIIDLDLDMNHSNYLRETFNEEWKLLDKSNSYPVIMMVKRKLLLPETQFSISQIIDDNHLEFSEAISKIFYNRYNNIECNKKIDKSDIEIVKLYGYKDFISPLKTVEEEEEIEEVLIDEYGKISYIMLVGALLITIGVIMTIIMIVR